jgi:5-(carboxyamino)imidazole ribonucleotide synthase
VTDLPLGIIGGGQLAWMFVLAAHRLGEQVFVYAQDESALALLEADGGAVGSLDDVDAIAAFARSVRALTVDTEHIAPAALEAAADVATLWPSPRTLKTTQTRIGQRAALTAARLPVVPYTEIRSEDDLRAAAEATGVPAVLKADRQGYDGRGQVVVREPDGFEAAWDALGRRDAVLEPWVNFELEFSVITVRDPAGNVVAYDPIYNHHVDGVLDLSVWPSGIPEASAARAIEIGTEAAIALGVVGPLCTECYLMPDGSVLINECAARAHNSGHLTIEASETSQFAQQVLILAGMVAGPTTRVTPAAMANLLGVTHVADRGPWETPDLVTAYDYGKDIRPGRKVGHLTALASTPEEAKRLVLEARRALKP